MSASEPEQAQPAYLFEGRDDGIYGREEIIKLSCLQEFAGRREKRKLLLMPRNVKENEVLFQLCRETGENVVNLVITSLADVAQECYLWRRTVCGEIPKKFSKERGILSILGIMRELHEKDQLSFFDEKWIDVPTGREIFRNLTLCRKYGVSAEQLRQVEVSGEKEKAKMADFAAILEQYEASGVRWDYVDETELYRCAAEAVKNREALPPTVHFDSVGMEKGDYEALSLAERNFLEALLKALGIENGMPELFEDDAEQTAAPAGGKVSDRVFFSGYGAVNEVSYVAEEILRQGSHFDDISVLCPNEAYITAVAEQFQEWGIPAVCDGIPIRHSSSVEILERFYRYVSGGYDRSLFVELLRTDGITVPKAEGEEIDGREREKRLLEGLREICPEKRREMVDLSDAASGLREFLLQYTYVKKDILQRTAYGAVLAMLGDYGKVKNCFIPYESAVKCFLETASSLTATVDFMETGKQEEKEQEEVARVQVRPLSAVRFINTPVVFVLGMTAGGFPAQEHDSPVLSDEVRRSLGILELQRERSAKILKRFQYALMLHNTEGHKQYFGYNAYALANLTEQVPCLMFRMLREQDGETREGGVKEIETYDFLRRQRLGEYFAQKRRGSIADKLNKETEDTDAARTFDALVRPQDGMGKTDYVLSATGLSTLVVCPMKYYLRFELGLAEQDEPYIRPGEWLSADERGTLIHSVLEEYVNEVYIQAQISDGAKREDILKKLLDEKLKEMCKYRPPCKKLKEMCEYRLCTDYLYRREMRLAEAALMSYIDRIEEDGYVPIHTEYAIGNVVSREHYDAGAVEIPVSTGGRCVGKIILNGVIDRIDKRVTAGTAEDGCGGGRKEEYRIIDYKTGEKPKTDGEFDFIVQDYLYAKAWQRILADQGLDGKVAAAVYEYIYRPTEDGHERLKRSDADWGKAEEYVAQVLEKVQRKGYVSFRNMWDRGQDDPMLEKAGKSNVVRYCPYAGFCPAAEEHCGKGAAKK